MSKSQLWAACAAASLAVVLLVAGVPAQQTGQPVQPLGGQPIYLLDISYVFKNYTKLKAMREQMQASAQQAEEQIRQRRETVKKLQEDLERLRPGTPDYKTLDEQITKRIADINVGIAMTRKDLMDREAKDYFVVYQEVMDEVHYFASQNRAALVLRFDRDAVDPQVPETVARALSRQVIWNNQGLDITDYILGNMHRRLGAADSRTRPTVPLGRGG